MKKHLFTGAAFAVITAAVLTAVLVFGMVSCESSPRGVPPVGSREYEARLRAAQARVSGLRAEMEALAAEDAEDDYEEVVAAITTTPAATVTPAPAAEERRQQRERRRQRIAELQEEMDEAEKELEVIIASAPEQPADGATAQNNSSGRADPDSAHWDIASLDTAAHVDYLSPAEKDVILEMNKARADPNKYAELYIKPMLHYNWGGPFGENSYLAPGATVYRSTNEGKNGIQSCIDDLSGRQSAPPLLPTEGLYLAARDHVDDTGPKGMTGHTGSDDSSMRQRIERYEDFVGTGECISYGHNTGREIVVQLLIDDGVPDRGHRNIILRSGYKYAGAAIGSHSRYTYMCVIDYATEYTDAFYENLFQH